ncbi:VanZ family protein [Motilimonas pumila]|uniref:VanZ family protein n=2 Tax=Motilimonas pumila TaxID=2303987 RepID=A0A418YL28_9GAMM|nr:VanZ family protein [Motilimonas pumila]
MIAAISWLAFTPKAPGLDIQHFDKINHLAAFSSLTLIALLAFSVPASRIYLGLLGYGITIELVQSQLPNRFASVADIAADGVGIILGAGLYWITEKWLMKKWQWLR